MLRPSRAWQLTATEPCRRGVRTLAPGRLGQPTLCFSCGSTFGVCDLTLPAERGRVSVHMRSREAGAGGWRASGVMKGLNGTHRHGPAIREPCPSFPDSHEFCAVVRWFLLIATGYVDGVGERAGDGRGGNSFSSTGREAKMEETVRQKRASNSAGNMSQSEAGSEPGVRLLFTE